MIQADTVRCLPKIHSSVFPQPWDNKDKIKTNWVMKQKFIKSLCPCNTELVLRCKTINASKFKPLIAGISDEEGKLNLFKQKERKGKSFLERYIADSLFDMLTLNGRVVKWTKFSKLVWLKNNSFLDLINCSNLQISLPQDFFKMLYIADPRIYNM